MGWWATGEGDDLLGDAPADRLDRGIDDFFEAFAARPADARRIPLMCELLGALSAALSERLASDLAVTAVLKSGRSIPPFAMAHGPEQLPLLTALRYVDGSYRDALNRAPRPGEWCAAIEFCLGVQAADGRFWDGPLELALVRLTAGRAELASELATSEIAPWVDDPPPAETPAPEVPLEVSDSLLAIENEFWANGEPLTWLVKRIEQEAPEARYAAMTRFDVVEGMLVHFARSDPDGQVRAHALARAVEGLIGLSADVQRMLAPMAAQVPDPVVRTRLATQLDRSLDLAAEAPALLELLSKDAVADVRAAAAATERLPVSAAEKLSKDPDALVRASSRATQPGLLATLSVHPRRSVRLAAARNPRLPQTAINRLAASPEVACRAAVAANPSVHEKLLTHLATDESPEVRLGVLTGWVRLPTPLLASLAEDGAPEVRRAAARYKRLRTRMERP